MGKDHEAKQVNPKQRLVWNRITSHLEDPSTASTRSNAPGVGEPWHGNARVCETLDKPCEVSDLSSNQTHEHASNNSAPFLPT